MTKRKTAHTERTVKGGGNDKRYSKNSTSESASQPVYAANGRVIGQVVGDTFRKSARGSVHMLRAPRGWAIDTDTLAELRALGVAQVTVTDTESGITYAAPLTTFERYGVAFNRGFGPQVALPLGYWSVDGKPPRLGQSRQRNPDDPRQLPLFAGADA